MFLIFQASQKFTVGVYKFGIANAHCVCAYEQIGATLNRLMLATLSLHYMSYLGVNFSMWD